MSGKSKSIRTLTVAGAVVLLPACVAETAPEPEKTSQAVETAEPDAGERQDGKVLRVVTKSAESSPSSGGRIVWK